MLVNVKNVVGSSRYPQSQDNTTWKSTWKNMQAVSDRSTVYAAISIALMLVATCIR